MEFTGEYRIPAERERVWSALVDPDILRQCIPGCESVEQVSDSEYTARMRVKIGPVSARFTGGLTIADARPPEAYTLVGEGKGGAAGFAKGQARVTLEENDGATTLRYQAGAKIGGKLAQIGSRMLDSASHKLADDFFGRFTAALVGQAAAQSTEEAISMAKKPTVVIEDETHTTETAAHAGHPEMTPAAEHAGPPGPYAADFPGRGSYDNPNPWLYGGIVVWIICLALIYVTG